MTTHASRRRRARLSALILATAAAAALGCATPSAIAPPPATGAGAEGVADDDLIEPPDAMDLPGGADAITLESKVAAVTVYSDRAMVTRTAVARIGKEPAVFAFRRLPGWVDDGSVRVLASAGRIADVRVERSFLARATDESCVAAEEAHRALAAKLAALTDELAVLDAQKAQIESIKAFSLEKITKDTTIGDISVASYSDVLAFISDSLRETARARREVLAKQAKVAPEYEASQRRLDEMKSLMQLEETTVLVTLQDGEETSSTIELTYLMPGATWEPMHELRVSTSDSKAVEVISYAAVTQTSGEDWGDAALSFSTQSTVQSVRIPELEALTLGDTSTATRIITSRLSSFSRAQKAFEGQNQLWNKVHQKVSAASEQVDFEQVYRSNMEYLQVVQSKTVQIFESLKNRGTTAHFKAAAAHGVRGDGHPARLRIGRATLGSAQRIVAAPEQSLNAARTLDMTNTTGQPFLPGKVALYQDGAFLGMTDIDFIAQGESFSLFLSVADHLKLTRTLDRKQSSLTQRRRNSMRVAFVVTVENLSETATELVLADRIPVSENKDIKVGNVQIAPACGPDSQGILRWTVTLKPKEVREFRIGYEVDYPPELILDARRKREAAPQPSPAAARYSFDDDSPYDIQEQIADLEELL